MNTKRSLVIGPILTTGFGAAVLMWIAWYLGHIPGLVVPPVGVGAAMIVGLIVAAVAAGRLVRKPWLVGLGAGLLAGLLDLLVLASAVGGSADGFGEPRVLWWAPAFLVACAVVGAISALAGALCLPRPAQELLPPGRDPWLARFGLLTPLVFIPLVVIGASVTSTDSGLSVAGWPRSDGYMMFLYPIELMTRPRVFLEHGHRLFGTFVGLTTLTMFIYVLVRESRRWVHVLAGLIFLGVVVQGVLGGLRVTETSVVIGALHGILAQILVGLAVALAVVLSASFVRADASTSRYARRFRAMATGLTHALILQLALGAFFRHFDEAGIEHANYILYAHVGFSIVVVVFACATAFTLRLTARDVAPRVLGFTGAAMLACVVIQFVLGWAALYAVMGSPARPAPPGPDQLAQAVPVPMFEAIITTAHQANGALLIALAAIAITWARRVKVSDPAHG